MIELVIADDHAIFRHGLKNLLSEEKDFRVLAEVETGTEAFREIREKQPQVAILDVSMPEKNGVEVVAEVHRAKLKTRCILLTVHDDPEIAATAIRNGATGYLLKNRTFRDLAQAVRVVAAGRKYFSPELMPALVDVKNLQKMTQLLTRREHDVLKLVVRGLSAKEIAVDLGISDRTVDTHKTHIMNKLDVHSTAALISYALRNKLVSDLQEQLPLE